MPNALFLRIGKSNPRQARRPARRGFLPPPAKRSKPCFYKQERASPPYATSPPAVVFHPRPQMPSALLLRTGKSIPAMRIVPRTMVFSHRPPNSHLSAVSHAFFGFFGKSLDKAKKTCYNNSAGYQTTVCNFTEKYSRGRRGAPAKGVGWLYRRESSNLSFSANTQRVKKARKH